MDFFKKLKKKLEKDKKALPTKDYFEITRVFPKDSKSLLREVIWASALILPLLICFFFLFRYLLGGS